MTPAMEHLVRLMLLLPPDMGHPIWASMRADCGNSAEVLSMRGFIKDTVQMWPPAGPKNLASCVLSVFDDPSEETLRHVSAALVFGEARQSMGPGQAWVDEAKATAVRVLAEIPDHDHLLQLVEDHWTLKR